MFIRYLFGLKYDDETEPEPENKNEDLKHTQETGSFTALVNYMSSFISDKNTLEDSVKQIEQISEEIGIPELKVSVKDDNPEDFIKKYKFNAFTGADYKDIYENIKKIYDSKKFQNKKVMENIELFGKTPNINTLMAIFDNHNNDIINYVKKAEEHQSQKYSLPHLALIIIATLLYKYKKIDKNLFAISVAGIFSHYIKHVTEYETFIVDYSKGLGIDYATKLNFSEYAKIIETELLKFKNSFAPEFVEVMNLIEKDLMSITEKSKTIDFILKIILLFKRFLIVVVHSDNMIFDVSGFIVSNIHYFEYFLQNIDNLTDSKEAMDLIINRINRKSIVTSTVQDFMEKMVNNNKDTPKYLVFAYSFILYLRFILDGKKLLLILDNILNKTHLEFLYVHFLKINEIIKLISDKNNQNNTYEKKFSELINVKGTKIMLEREKARNEFLMLEKFIGKREFYITQLTKELSTILKYFNRNFSEGKGAHDLSSHVNSVVTIGKNIYNIKSFSNTLKKYATYPAEYKSSLELQYNNISEKILENSEITGGETGVWWLIVILIICIIILIILIVIYKIRHGRSIAIT